MNYADEYVLFVPHGSEVTNENGVPWQVLSFNEVLDTEIITYVDYDITVSFETVPSTRSSAPLNPVSCCLPSDFTS